MREYFDSRGYPLKPQSIFIGVRRAVIPDEQRLIEATRHQIPIALPCRFVGEWAWLNILIAKITVFSDGKVLSCKSGGRGLLENWASFQIWIPNSGSCGVLN